MTSAAASTRATCERERRSVLDRVDLVRVTDRVLDAAAILRPFEPRSLDAIHLATAQQLGRELRALASYDERIVKAAKHLGYRVVQPR